MTNSPQEAALAAHISSLSVSPRWPLLAAAALVAALALMWGPTCAPAGDDDLRLVDVLGELDRTGEVAIGAAGGLALQAPGQGSVVRFFREGRSARLRGASGRRTVFMQDAFTPVTLRGGERLQALTAPADSSAERVAYFIDGDLIVDSNEVLSFVVGGYRQMEVIVRGDIVVADDVFAAEGTHLTFTAVKREDGSGGHIVLEDIAFGTLEVVEADLFAEGTVWVAGEPIVRGEIASHVVGR
jgi:hypothetical protein